MRTTAFIGGGNMASALVGGLLASGHAPASVLIVEPDADRRRWLRERFAVEPRGGADASLAAADVVVWAVKPQLFRAAAAPCAPHVGQALQLSVMAGVRSDAIAAATACERVVRAMPNTPALIGQGIAGLFARLAVAEVDRRRVEALLKPTGETIWFEREEALDAVTALSGSGPAYVFYVIEAMVRAGTAMGLGTDDARRLAVGTVVGASALAAASAEPVETLRRNVTSPGGTTHAAISELERSGVGAAFIAAIEAARQRARELGDEFGPP